MIGFVRQKISVVDSFFLLLLIVPHPQKKLTTTADPSNLTQCVLQDNDRGLNFGCSGTADSMTWIRLGYYGRTQSASPSQFCENPAPSANDCIPDPRGDRRNIGAWCNTYTTCSIYGSNGKTYNDIVALCPNSGGFPYAYVSYECLPRRQADGNFINTVNSWETSAVYSNYYGKIYFETSGYPYSMTDKNVQFQLTVDGNTKVSIRLLDANARLLDATGPCPYTLYMYSSMTNIYREWCVNRTSWSVDDSTPVVFPALQGSGPGSQNIDIVFSKTNANSEAQGAMWMLVEAVNVVDNSPGRNINVSSGTSFTPQVRPTTSTTTTTPTTTTPTTTTPTTTTPTTTTPTTTTSTTTTTTTTTPTTTTPTTTQIATRPTPSTPTTTTTTSTTTTPTTTTTTTTPMPSPTTTTSSTVMLSSATSSNVKFTPNDTTELVVSPLTMTSNPSPTTMSTSAGGTNVNDTYAAVTSQNTSLIIGVVVAIAGVIIIIVIVVVVAVICRRKPDRKSKPRPPMMVGVDSHAASYNNNDDNSSKFSSIRHNREHIYDEIHETSVAVTTVSYPPQQHHPASPTILRIGRGQSRKSSGVVKVRFTTPGGDEDLVFYPGVSSNISDDDKANRQTAQNANEVHPRLKKDFSSSKRLSFVSRQDSVPSPAGDPDTGIQLNPVYGYRPADIYMY